MSEIALFTELFRYGVTANRMVLDAALKLSDAQLDQPLDLGPGSVRRIASHLLHGEATWLARFTGQSQAPWPAQEPRVSIEQILMQLNEVDARRRPFIAGLSESALDARLPYRDSKGSMFIATLRQMLIQSVMHSHHHRAQLVNAVRRVGGDVVEVDYMYSVRSPA